MKNLYTLVLLFSITLFYAQTVTTNTTLTLDEVLESITTDLECTSISNVTSPSNSQLFGEGFNSFGSFEFVNEPFFPFESGIVLSTSNASDLTTNLGNGSSSWLGDSDLEALIAQPGNTYNATTIEFDFVPFRDKLQVDYILASNEYPNFVCAYADTFAFIVSGPGIPNVNSYDHDANPNTPMIDLDLGGKNIATFTGTEIIINPTNAHDLTANCPPGSLGEFAVAQLYDSQNSGNNILDYNGQVVPLTAEIDLVPGQTYHIKLVIADRGDSILNSAVFIDANSFVIGTIPEDLPYQPGLPVSLPSCWNTSGFASYEVTNECTQAGENHIKMYGGDYSITTAAVDANGLQGLDVSFDLLNGCEDAAEAGENLLVEYFDGSNWQLLDNIDPANLPNSFSGNNNWQTFNYTVSSGLSYNFMLRFTRTNGTNLEDDISLSNISFTNSTLSNAEFLGEADFSFYPNPITDNLHIENANTRPITLVEIYDLQGRIVKSDGETVSDVYTLDLNELQKGTYIAKVYVGNQFLTKKIIKQ